MKAKKSLEYAQELVGKTRPIPVWAEEVAKRIMKIKNPEHKKVAISYWFESPKRSHTVKNLSKPTKPVKPVNVTTILHRHELSIDHIYQWLESQSAEELIITRENLYNYFGINT